jgi:hypothetical protein
MAISRDDVLREAAACLADPDIAGGDGALLVLADRLQLTGDPANAAIGELLVAQLAPAKRPSAKRMKELEMAAVRAWVGPLDAMIDPRSVGFARGVPASARVTFAAASDPSIPLREADRLWPLLAHVDLDRAPAQRAVALFPRLDRAWRIAGALPEVVGLIGGGLRPPALTSLACYLGRGRSSMAWYISGDLVEMACEVIRDDAALREVRHGDPFAPAAYTWLPRALTSLSVSNLEARTGPGSLEIAGWLAALATAPATLTRFELTEHVRADFDPSGGWSVVFTRGHFSRAFDTALASYRGGPSRSQSPAKRLLAGLARIPPRSIVTLTYGPMPKDVHDELAVRGDPLPRG